MVKHFFIVTILSISIVTIQAQTWTEIQKTLPEPYLNNTYEFFGNSVCVDENYAVIGAYGYNNFQGRACILYFNGVSWEHIAELVASDGEFNDKLGYSVSISGNYVVIGTYQDNGIGSAYIFEKPATGWINMTETAKLIASDGETKNYFGYSVGISNNTVVVGSYNDDYKGSAYIFEKPVSGWVNMTETAKLTSSDLETDDCFGYSVNVSDNTVVIGANKNDNKGSAYVFEKPVSGWTNMNETAKLTASDGEIGDDFGYSIGISNDAVVVGAVYGDSNMNDEGSAYVFEKPVSGWTDMIENAKLTASDGGDNDQFGYSVGISNNNIVVGAIWSDSNGLWEGSAYIFEKPVTGWINMTETAILTASDGEPSDKFGNSVCISYDKVFISARNNNDGGGYNSGSSYFFEKPGTVWLNMNENQKILPLPYLNNAIEYYGRSVSVSGNYAVVGAYGYNDWQGRAYVLFYNGTVWENIAVLTTSDGLSKLFGFSVCILGDNIVVGSYGDNDYTGSAYVFVKPVTGWADMTETAKLTASDGEEDEKFGYSVAISNNSITIGAYGERTDYYDYNRGAAYVFEKPVTGWSNMTETAKLTASDGEYYDHFGYSVDSFEENIVIGATRDDNDKGSAYIFQKPVSGWTDMTETGKLTASNHDIDDYMGFSVSIYGDYIVVSADGDDDNGSNAGSAYIFEKPVSGWSNMNETYKLIASDGENDDYFGYSVDIFGDNILIGSLGSEETGSVYYFKKPQTGWTNMSETSKLVASDGETSDEFGRSADISNEHVIIGAYLNDDNGRSSGSAYFFDVDIISSLNDISAKNCVVFPNPTNGFIKIEQIYEDIKLILISDITGKTIFERSKIQQNEIIDLSDFDSGIYIISIQTDNEIFIAKVVKR